MGLFTMFGDDRIEKVLYVSKLIASMTEEELAQIELSIDVARQRNRPKAEPALSQEIS